MGWQVGYDSRWGRDIGYGVPAICDKPACGTRIDRGIEHVCGGTPYGGVHGCGLYFCEGDLTGTIEYDAHDGTRRVPVCERCFAGEPPFDPTPDTAEWVEWKLADESWEQWREENVALVEQMKASLGAQCCDLHGRNCEPPSELCCEHCTEARHGGWTDGRGTLRTGHPDGETCSNPDLSAALVAVSE